MRLLGPPISILVLAAALAAQTPPATAAAQDATDLTDRIDLELRWTPDQGTGNVGALTDGTSLFTAVQEQLALRLEPRQTPVNAFVIESAERPTDD